MPTSSRAENPGNPTGSGGPTGSPAALNPTYSYSQSTYDETPLNAYYSPEPTIQASAWQLQDPTELQISTGQFNYGGAASPQALSNVQRGAAMLDLYGAFTLGKPLSAAQLHAAQQLGGDIARAAEMVGVAKAKAVIPKGQVAGTAPGYETVIPQGQVAGTAPGYETARPVKAKRGPSGGQKNQAVVAAQKELTQRLHTTLGVDPSNLTEGGLKAKAPSQLVQVMQQAGYPVTASMSMGQLVQAAGGQGPQGTPGKITSTPKTVAQLLQGLGNGTVGANELTHLQQSLYNGGYYDPEYYEGTKVYSPGHLDTGTVMAMSEAIQATAQAQKSDPNATLASVIAGGAPGGSVIGTAAPEFPVATAAQLQGTLENASESYLGRAPTQAELGSFTSSLDAQELAGNKKAVLAGESPSGLVDYNTGVPFLPKVPTPTQAAASYIQNTNPTEYQGHNVADAFGMLMNLIDRQNVSAYTTLGNRPNTTS